MYKHTLVSLVAAILAVGIFNSNSAFAQSSADQRWLETLDFADYDYKGYAVTRSGWYWEGHSGQLPSGRDRCPVGTIPAVTGSTKHHKGMRDGQDLLDLGRVVRMMPRGETRWAYARDVTPIGDSASVYCVTEKDLVATHEYVDVEVDRVRREIPKPKKEYKYHLELTLAPSINVQGVGLRSGHLGFGGTTSVALGRFRYYLYAGISIYGVSLVAGEVWAPLNISYHLGYQYRLALIKGKLGLDLSILFDVEQMHIPEFGEDRAWIFGPAFKGRLRFGKVFFVAGRIYVGLTHQYGGFESPPLGVGGVIEAGARVNLF